MSRLRSFNFLSSIDLWNITQPTKKKHIQHYAQVKEFFPFLGQLRLQHSLSTVQKVPTGEQLLGVGAGGVGAGGGGGLPLVGHACHQQTFPPFPHPSGLFSMEQLPPAGKPSAQIVAGRGWVFVHTYLSTVVVTTGGFVGGGITELVGLGVGGAVTGASVG